ncbi:I78 family peptidase inhibitor [Altericroceibacterium endophyticum]|nr:I78 family peptidase inhibitor [Altericroceibacterium endophyticum]
MALAACGETQPVGGQDDAAHVDSEIAQSAPYPDYGPVELEGDQELAGPNACNLARAERFVGQLANSDTRARLMKAVAPLLNIRWVGPGMATTDDLRPDRLNVHLNAGNTITRVTCG